MPSSLNNVYALVLAAGASSRMGSAKQLLPWQGKTLLEQALSTAQQLLAERVIVILGANAELIQNQINLDGTSSVINHDWQLGMAGSLQLGIKSLPADCQAILILLCDQPLITSQHLQQLLQIWLSHPQQIVASAYAQGLGVPVIFPAHYFTKLQVLTGDQGAKRLLRDYAAQVISVEIPQAALDIDRIEDYQRLLDTLR